MPTRVIKAPMVVVADPEATAAAREEAHRAELSAAYQAGLSDGRALAEREGLAAVPRLVEAVRRAVAAVDAATAAAEAAASRAVAEAAVELAAWIVRREVSADPSLLAHRLADAMRHLRPAAGVVIRVAPTMVGPLSDWVGEAGIPAVVEADPALDPGEARVLAGDCGADLTMAAALARVREALEVSG
jgi:flagellar biosynthesis/type III secretory pathway protein FliH